MPARQFDKQVFIRAEDIEPTVTWGTSPEDVVPIGGVVPVPGSFADASKQQAAQVSLDYMGLQAGTKMTDVAIENVFIGSCTNSRIEDIRAAAEVLKGRKKADNVKWAIVVPGSGLVKAQAEAEGLDKIITDAGLEWREPGCSACLAMNPDKVPPGERCASTSNRNFTGRQGPGSRTHLMSPAMAAAAAVTGRLTDVRELVGLRALADAFRQRPEGFAPIAMEAKRTGTGQGRAADRAQTRPVGPVSLAFADSIIDRPAADLRHGELPLVATNATAILKRSLASLDMAARLAVLRMKPKRR